MSLHPLRHSSRHEWLVGGCLLGLLGLLASAVAGGLPGAETVPVQLLAPAGQGQSSPITEDGLGLVVDGG